MSSSLYIADLHLQSSRPELTELAFALLDTAACETLYIIGDLFEYWIGDDSVDKTAASVRSKLKALTGRGTRIFVMHGNRDFLLGDEFVTSFGGTLLEQDVLLENIAGASTLLMHGDTLCTDDTQYQFYRRMVRNRDWQKDFLAKSASEREATARMIRNTSKVRGGRSHKDGIADINEQSFFELLDDHCDDKQHVTRVIHGHTHRPASHTHKHHDHTVERLVLGDWHNEHAVVAVSDDKNCELVKWDGTKFQSLV